MPPKRPSHKELNKKLNQARDFLESSGYLPLDPAKVASDFFELDLLESDEQIKAVKIAFSEVKADYYAGSRPPKKAFEASIKEEELFEFVWESESFGRSMYLKFCLPKSSKGCSGLYLLSLHKSRPSSKGGKKS